MTFPAEVADKLIQAAAEAGVGRDSLFAAAAVEPAAALSYAGLCALYEAAARLTGDDAIGLRVGERTRADDYGLLGYAAAHSTSLGEALERLVALQGVWTEAVSFALERQSGAARLVYRAHEPLPAEARCQESEQMMAALLAFARTGTGQELRPLEVRFEHRAPADSAGHERVFGCPVSFAASATELVLAERTLALPMTAADPKLGALIRGQAESALAERSRTPPLVEQVRAAARAALSAGRAPTLAEAAAAAGIGPRTLQRRLAETGNGWRSLADEARIGLARELLADPGAGLAQIAFRAGFSQASAFHRAFMRIEGTTPRRYRLAVLARRQRR